MPLMKCMTGSREATRHCAALTGYTASTHVWMQMTNKEQHGATQKQDARSGARHVRASNMPNLRCLTGECGDKPLRWRINRAAA